MLDNNSISLSSTGQSKHFFLFVFHLEKNDLLKMKWPVEKEILDIPMPRRSTHSWIPDIAIWYLGKGHYNETK